MNSIQGSKKRIMKAAILSLLVMCSLSTPDLAIGSEGNDMNKHPALNQRQESIIAIAAFTANGDMDKLKVSLSKGLDAGLTVNESKEILTQMYAYAGFPRSLNGLFTFMAVMDERKAKGIKDEMGKEASPIPADLNRDEYGAKIRAQLAGLDKVPPPSPWQEFSPIIDSFLKEHLFSDIFARDVLTFQERELATVAALAAMTGTEGQLRFHFEAAMNTGLTEAQMKGVVSVLLNRVGETQAERAQKVLAEVLSKRNGGGHG